MSEQTDNLKSLLQPYGLSPDEASVYLEILGKNVLTALQVSRNIRMGRTKVYRILDKLIALQLVTQQFDDMGMKFVANDPTQLELLLTQREGELNSLRASLPKVVSTLERQMGIGQQGSKTLYYKGKEGLSQVNFNLVRANNEFFSYEVSTAEAYMTHQDAEQLRQDLVANHVKAISITNQTYFTAFTDVTEFVEKYCQIRYIDPKVFEIKADVFIYNDVHAICNYVHNNDVFCVEIYNQALADMQKQLFQNLWNQAKPINFLNSHGEAKLIS